MPNGRKQRGTPPQTPIGKEKLQSNFIKKANGAKAMQVAPADAD